MASLDASTSLQSDDTDTHPVCRCIHCCDTCSTSSTEEYYLSYTSTRLPHPCPQRQLTDAFSPETHFIESPIVYDDHVASATRRSRLNGDGNPPGTHLYLSVISEQQYDEITPRYPSTHDHPVAHHPSGVPVPCVSMSSTGEASRPLVTTATVKQNRRLKTKTIVALFFLLGILFLVVESINDLLHRQHRQKCPSQQIWNYPESSDSLLESTICFPCSLLRQDLTKCFVKQKTSDLKSTIVKTTDNKVHCCRNRFGFLKWVVNLTKTQPNSSERTFILVFITGDSEEVT